jgi:hypothetical protein
MEHSASLNPACRIDSALNKSTRNLWSAVTRYRFWISAAARNKNRKAPIETEISIKTVPHGGGL